MLRFKARQYILFTSVDVAFRSKEKAKARNRYNQVPNLTRDAIWESDKNKESSHIREPRGQPFSKQVPTSSHKTARNRQDSIIKANVKRKYQKL